MKGYNVVENNPSCIWIDNELVSNRIDSKFFSIKYIEYYNKITNSGISCETLERISSRMNSGPFGSALLASHYVNEGVPFIRPLNCKNYIVQLSKDNVYITEEDSLRLKSSTFSGGALLFTKIGNGIGDVAVIPEIVDKCTISGNLMGANIKDSYNNYYVLIVLKSKYGQNQIWQGMMNSAKPKIDMDTLKSILIPIPSFEVQKYIGDKVRKAEKLRDEAKRLKAELEILFQRYTGLHYEETNIGEVKRYGYIQPDDIGSMIVAEVYKPDYIENQRKIKELEKVSNLNECYEYIVNGVDCRDYSDETGTEYYKVGSISMFGIKEENKSYVNMPLIDVTDKQKINEGDLLITRKGSFGIAMAVSKKDEIGIISSEVFKLKIKHNWDTDYLAYFLNSEFGKKQFNQYATGSTMKGINQQNIVEIIIPYVPYRQQTEIGDLVRVIKNKIEQSKQLIQEAKQDVEDLIEGNFDMSKLN